MGRSPCWREASPALEEPHFVLGLRLLLRVPVAILGAVPTETARRPVVGVQAGCPARQALCPGRRQALCSCPAFLERRMPVPRASQDRLPGRTHTGIM